MVFNFSASYPPFSPLHRHHSNHLQIWVYGSSPESSLVAVVVPKKPFLDQHSDLSSQEAKKAMLAVRLRGCGGFGSALRCSVLHVAA